MWCHLLAMMLLATSAFAADGEIDGDVFAGWHVVIDGRVRGSAVASGAIVDIGARVDDDALVAAGRIAVSGVVGGDLAATGLSIRLAPSAVVAGNAWLAGARVETAGQIGGTVRIVGWRVALGGEIAGDVDIYAASIDVLPDAVVKGRVTYHSPEPARIDAAARLSGVEHQGVVWPTRLVGIVGAVVAVVAIGIGLLAAAIALIAVAAFPNFTAGASNAIAAHPWSTLGLGLALLFGLPMAAAFALVTVIGSVMAVPLVAVYLLSLPLALAVGALHLGRLGLGAVGRSWPMGAGWRLVALAVGIAVTVLGASIPWIGPAVPCAVLLFGLGAVYREAFRRWRLWVEPVASP